MLYTSERSQRLILKIYSSKWLCAVAAVAPILYFAITNFGNIAASAINMLLAGLSALWFHSKLMKMVKEQKFRYYALIVSEFWPANLAFYLIISFFIATSLRNAESGFGYLSWHSVLSAIIGSLFIAYVNFVIPFKHHAAGNK